MTVHIVCDVPRARHIPPFKCNKESVILKCNKILFVPIFSSIYVNADSFSFCCFFLSVQCYFFSSVYLFSFSLLLLLLFVKYNVVCDIVSNYCNTTQNYMGYVDIFLSLFVFCSFFCFIFPFLHLLQVRQTKEL